MPWTCMGTNLMLLVFRRRYLLEGLTHTSTFALEHGLPGLTAAVTVWLKTVEGPSKMENEVARIKTKTAANGSSNIHRNGSNAINRIQKGRLDGLSPALGFLP